MAKPAAVEHFAVIDSTSNECKRRAVSGETGPFWIRADQQTGGRGRLGRSWQSPKGNLYASGLYRFSEPAQKLAELGFVASLAILESLQAYLQNPAQLKWPNDVLIDGAKIAGVLPETGAGEGAGAGENENWLVIGIGINLAVAPEVPMRAVTCLQNEIRPTKTIPTPETLLNDLIQNFDSWLQKWQQDGFSPVRARWLHDACGLGQRVQVSSGQTGVFEDMSEEGALLLRMDTGKTLAINAGEVFFP